MVCTVCVCVFVWKLDKMNQLNRKNAVSFSWFTLIMSSMWQTKSLCSFPPNTLRLYNISSAPRFYQFHTLLHTHTHTFVAPWHFPFYYFKNDYILLSCMTPSKHQLTSSSTDIVLSDYFVSFTVRLRQYLPSNRSANHYKPTLIDRTLFKLWDNQIKYRNSKKKKKQFIKWQNIIYPDVCT